MEKIISVNSKKLKKKKRKEASPIILERVNIHFTLPKALTLFWKRPRNKLIKITDKFRNYYARKSICINLDFSETEKMFVDGTLYLLAELDTLKSTNSDIKFKLKLSKDLIVNQVLKQTGILDLLNINLTFEEELDETVRYWKYSSGSKVELDLAEEMLNDFDEILSENSSKNIYNGITEALTNCHHHAYLEKRFINDPQKAKKWWLFSQEKDSKLTICVCDLGVGIPRSLVRNSENVQKDWFRNLKAFLKSHREKYDKDSASIKAAIEIGNTRTNLSNRGKGLNQIINQISTFCEHKASIAIFSNKGSYIINKGMIEDRPITNLVNGFSIPFNKSIDGTVIVWQIPIDKQMSSPELGASHE
ncbi:hypothetical protein [Acinetobacter towneri]|uniref:ATP-binding protein n=1 Tax=Acinetobacter towneri TaxID=202956 RepID=A0AB35M3M9_9GAMM|nr:hypothetical protein [Acinetobacter towneri]MBP6437580.1 hypothetical protein [Paludibacteraceae bacterium]MDM1720003.1 hypothetical protein [Acinetobacter towneri]MDM1732075.1 hypothetical protein [Acinetobacter towneri]MDM1734798.1 hypothetical protein [Acinetobacter towneri]MDM1745378.1 hypothetical protein [Acinetobacter towneri]